MIPAASNRRTRSATAGGVSPTCLPRSAYELRAFSWSAQSSSHPVSSSNFSESLVMDAHHFLFMVDPTELLWNIHSLRPRSFLSYHRIPIHCAGVNHGFGNRAGFTQIPYTDRYICVVHERSSGAEPHRAAFYRGAPCRPLVHPHLGRAGRCVVSAGTHHGRAGCALSFGWWCHRVYWSRPRATYRLAHRRAVSRGDRSRWAGDSARLQRISGHARAAARAWTRPRRGGAAGCARRWQLLRRVASHASPTVGILRLPDRHHSGAACRAPSRHEIG